ncbi:hypothetical protein QBC46DRAFT_73881 [Diplogelasinospora grovesii]|uniref:Uncharacterized protein n=1 Tax=Diplogelasinospora grovesii TaxID=303347 RepID=A0AAN6MWV4_9PEZI|nr:hypothetical protein QBC46DRAFT_73881 [Diplogelasinospora grovesii]
MSRYQTSTRPTGSSALWFFKMCRPDLLTRTCQTSSAPEHPVQECPVQGPPILSLRSSRSFLSAIGRFISNLTTAVISAASFSSPSPQPPIGPEIPTSVPSETERNVEMATKYGLVIYKQGSRYSVELESATGERPSSSARDLDYHTTNDGWRESHRIRIEPELRSMVVMFGPESFGHWFASHLSDTEIRAHWPDIADQFFGWQDQYEVACETCQDPDEAVFSSIEDAVVWAIEGFLFACWLILQDGICKVGYYSGEGPEECTLRKENVDAVLNQFLGDMDALIRV